MEETQSLFKSRVKKAGLISRLIAKSAIWYPLKVVLLVLWKVFSYIMEAFLTILIIGVITGVVVCCAFVLYINNNIDAEYDGLSNLKFDSSLNTTIYYVNDSGEEVLMEEDTLHGSENRLWAAYSEIPQDLIDAVISIEDQRFMQHNGVDLKRTAGAVLNFFLPSGGAYGGSTLTQQLIKNVSGDDETTIQRKVQEIFRAIYVEKNYTKEQILEMYLNIIYLSQNCNGVKAAAEAYFGKDISELTLVECAALAAIPKYPTYYDPIRNPDNNLGRRNLILKAMLEQGYITQEEFDNSYNVPLYLSTTEKVETSSTETVHSYYVDAVIDDVIAALMEHYSVDKTTASRTLYSGGLQIVINMDPDIQSIMEEVYCDDSCFPVTSGINPQSAMVLADPKTGEILGIVGGRGEKTTSRGLNRATMSTRQCGSSIKPLTVYSYGIDNGYITCATPISDTPTINQVKNADGKVTQSYWPPNSPAGYDGVMDVTEGLMKSKNTVAVRIAEMIGVENLFNQLVKIGFTTLVRSKTYNGSVKTDIALSPMALGAFTEGVTVREVTQGYTMFLNGGSVNELRTFSLVRDSNGEIIIDNRVSESVEAISEQTAYIMTMLLNNVTSNKDGTAYDQFAGKETETINGVKVKLPGFSKFGTVAVSGKTGTTNDNRDRYFVGYTPDYLAACWFGYDNNKSLAKFGYNPACRLWVEVMNRVYENLDAKGVAYNTTFQEPYGIVKVEYCTISGKLATDACKCDIETVTTGESCIRTGYFTYESAPTEYCDKHIMFKWDKKTKAICFDGCTCPQSDLIDVAFRLIDPRYFTTNLTVTDSQYTCVDASLLGEGYVFPTSDARPYFFNIYPKDNKVTTSIDESRWPGRSVYSSTFKPANRICIEHYNPDLVGD